MDTSHTFALALRAILIMLSQEHLIKHEVTSVFSTATPPKCLKGICCRRDKQEGARSLNQTVQWKSTLSDVTHMKRRQCRDTCVTQIVWDSKARGPPTGNGDRKWSYKISPNTGKHWISFEQTRVFDCTNTIQSYLLKNHNFPAREC